MRKLRNRSWLLLSTLCAPLVAAACSDDSSSNPLKPSDGGVDGAKEAGGGPEGGSDAPAESGGDGGAGLAKIQHLVVIYLENHSFDNLYGEFPNAEGIGALDASAPNVAQVDEGGVPYAALPMPTLPDGGSLSGLPATVPNAPFSIEDYIPEDAAPPDLHHIFFTEQKQIADGGMNRFALWSDAKGLVMGYYHTNHLPLAGIAKTYALCDHFHHAAFGGSFLNHQWLIAARTPEFASPPATIVQDPTALTFGASEKPVWQDPSDQKYYVINTAFSGNSPHPSFNVAPANLVPNQTHDTIGDRLSAKNLDWAWYSGGWNDAMAYSADAGVADGGVSPIVAKFQYHHQPFVYFAKYADGTPGRAQHLKDEADFVAAAKAGTLPAVSFVKPVGINNEHPGYTDVLSGEQHVVDLINAVKNGPAWKDTAIIITYDEHGGFWDHVAPPKGDKWGPGSRVPAIIVSPFAKKGFVDHTVYDTTSILRTIELRWGLAPLGARDGAAKDLTAAFDFTQ